MPSAHACKTEKHKHDLSKLAQRTWGHASEPKFYPEYMVAYCT